VNGNSRATFEESYRALADVLTLPRRHKKDADILALVRDHLQKDDVSPWLMVVDNADDARVFFCNNERDNISKHMLASYLPKSIKGKMLVTSRSLDVAERLVGHSRAILRLSVMEEVQALELLTTRLEGETDKAAAIELVRALGCIPLAVNQAAAYINRRSPRLSITLYLQKFRKSEKQKDSLLRSDKGDLGRYDGVSNSVVVTWQVTLDRIKQDRPSAAELLSLMSQFQAQNIPENLLRRYSTNVTDCIETTTDNQDDETGSNDSTDSDTLEDDIDTLQGYSLVRLASSGFFEMHPLVQFCTRSWISEFGDPARWSRLFLKLMATHFPSGRFETWGTCQSLLPHIEHLLRSKARSQGDILDLAELLTNVSRYMLRIGEYSQAEMLGNEAAEARKSVLGPEHADTLTSLSNLASTFWHQGRWEAAEKLEVEVMETRKAKFGADHFDTLISMGNLASTYREQGRWQAAEKLDLEVMETRKAKLGVDHPETLMSMGNLSLTYRKQGRWEEAEALALEVMETRKATLGADHPSTLTSMSNLAITWHGQGRQAKALALMQECVHLRQQKLGATHPHTQNSVAMLQAWQTSHLAAEDSFSI
jgi:tetratricopeptide (TPR) repeat protein